MENQEIERIEGIGINMPQVVANEDVIPLNCQTAFANLSEAEQEEVMALANSIDVTNVEKVLNYGSVALRMTFDQCGSFLKDERGSQADQEVIKQVVELSKKASSSYEDFLVLQEPNFFQKMILRVMGGKDRAEKIQNSAITNYKLLSELKSSCDEWLEMLQKAMGDIEFSALSDFESIGLLEKYIIAGNIAQKRVEGELDELQGKYQETGLQQYSYSYGVLKEGYDTFLMTMSNLEKSRIMYHLSIAQLSLVKRSNRNVQISIHTQLDNSIALISQQLRNAVLNAKTKEILEGQKAISRLNDELIRDFSRTIGITTQQTEKLIYAGFYNIEAAKEAVTTVIKSCEEIRKTASEMLPKMKADMTQIADLMKQLEPCVESAEISKIEDTPSTERVKLEF